MNIAQGLAHAVKIAGNHTAIVCGETEYTWVSAPTERIAWHADWPGSVSNVGTGWQYSCSIVTATNSTTPVPAWEL